MPQGEWTILHNCSATLLFSLLLLLQIQTDKIKILSYIDVIQTTDMGAFLLRKPHTSIQIITTLKGNAASVFSVVLFEWNVSDFAIKKASPDRFLLCCVSYEQTLFFNMHYSTLPNKCTTTPTHLTVLERVHGFPDTYRTFTFLFCWNLVITRVYVQLCMNGFLSILIEKRFCTTHFFQWLCTTTVKCVKVSNSFDKCYVFCLYILF